eukprot:961209_1
MATEFRANMIIEHINRAQSVHDLLPMLHLIELASIKDILKQQVRKLDVTETSNVFCASLSMEQILPTDIIQHITSFYNTSQIQTVSKTFNACHQQNMRRELQKRERKIMSEIQSDRKCNTFTCKKAHELEEAIEMANHGDTILVYDGLYGDATHTRSLTINKDLQIKGVSTSNSVRIEFYSIDIQSKRMHFQNVTMVVEDEILTNGALYLDTCTVISSCDGITFRSPNCVLDINDCKFIGDVDSCRSAIILEPAISINITHCWFSGWGFLEAEPCISVAHGQFGFPTDMPLTIRDNVFSNNHGAPIGAFDDCLRLSNSVIVDFDGNLMKVNSIAEMDLVKQFYSHLNVSSI